MKNLSEGELTKPEVEVLAKGLNFAITPDHISVADMITATESAIQNNNIPEDVAEQLRAQVSMSLLIANTPPPPPNLTLKSRITPSLSCQGDNKGSCAVVLNAGDYHSKVTSLLSDRNMYEPLKRDPTSKFKKKVISCLVLYTASYRHHTLSVWFTKNKQGDRLSAASIQFHTTFQKYLAIVLVIGGIVVPPVGCLVSLHLKLCLSLPTRFAPLSSVAVL